MFQVGDKIEIDAERVKKEFNESLVEIRFNKKENRIGTIVKIEVTNQWGTTRTYEKGIVKVHLGEKVKYLIDFDTGGSRLWVLEQFMKPKSFKDKIKEMRR